MKKKTVTFLPLLVLILFATGACTQFSGSNNNATIDSLVNQQSVVPVAFNSHLIPQDQLAHAGVFTPDMKSYYITLSDKGFEQFTVMSSHLKAGEWSTPQEAFFNSDYNEHGVHFTANNEWLYFSSTRPVGIDSIPNTWHIWRCKKEGEEWGKPEFVYIPGLENKLISHPSLTVAGEMYLHVANPVYSDMYLYKAVQQKGKFISAEKVNFPLKLGGNTLTPYVSPDGSFLLFVHVLNHEYSMYISRKSANNTWDNPQKLNERINNENKGNPYVTPDGKTLYYASGIYDEMGTPQDWIIQSVSTQSFLK